MRTELQGLLLLPSLLVTACSWGCSGEPPAQVATDTGTETSTTPTPDLGAPAEPCPHVFFGENDREWSLYSAAQALVAADLDGDGLRDLVVTLDHAPIGLFRNRGRDITSTANSRWGVPRRRQLVGGRRDGLERRRTTGSRLDQRIRRAVGEQGRLRFRDRER